MQTYTRDGETVTVGPRQQTRLSGGRCYKIEGSGSIEFFVGDSGEVLQVQERDDGTWTLWYKPNDVNFEEYAAELDTLGAWD